MPPGRRRSIALLLVLALAGCGLPRGESVLSPEDVSLQIRRSIFVELTRTEGLENTAAFPDVRATYVGQTTHERMLVVVFRSATAAVQVLGKQTPHVDGIVPIRYRNVVVLYQHQPATVSRAPRVAAALRHAASS